MDSSLYDLCIVGAGMFGSAAARHASAYPGVKVCLVGPKDPKEDEVKDREIFGAHYDEGRIARICDTDLLTQELAKASIGRYRELERLSGITFYEPTGFLVVGKKNSSYMKTVQQMCGIFGTPLVDLSHGDILKKRFPFLKFKEDDQVLLEDTGAGYINPRKMVHAQIKVAQDQGCNVEDDVVEEVITESDGTHKISTKSGKTIKAKRVLICTGAFTNFKKFPFSKVDMKLTKETVALLKVSSEEVTRLSSMPTILYACSDEKWAPYVFPPIKYPDGNFYLKIGIYYFEVSEEIDSLEEVAEWYKSKGEPKTLKHLTEVLTNMLPGLKYEECVGKTCVYCINTTGQPYIDRITPTLAVAMVGNGRGAKFSDEVGRIAATLSVTGKWDSVLNKSNFEAIFKEQKS